MELQIIRAREFVRLGAHGHFDLKASKAVLAQLARACCKRGINQALVDLRALHPKPKPVFSPNDLVTLVNTFREVGFTHKQRLAVLYGSDPHHRARLFAFIAKLRGWKVQAFDSFEEAVIWLSGGEESHAEKEFTPRAKKVVVRQLKALKASAETHPATDHCRETVRQSCRVMPFRSKIARKKPASMPSLPAFLYSRKEIWEFQKKSRLCWWAKVWPDFANWKN